MVRLPGRLRLDAVSKWIGKTWTGSSTTVGGFITESVGHLPEVGEDLVIQGIELQVESVENHVVTSVLARPATGSNAPEVIDG